MRLSQLRISNFRCFDDVTIVFDDYTCFVGPNGAGKSTVLTALNVFFRETANAVTDTQTLTKEDFHLLNTARDIEIEATFTDLNAYAQDDFKDYYRNGKLIIAAIARWNDTAQNAPVKQYGYRMGMEHFRQYFDADKAGAKASDLSAIYETLRASWPDLPSARTKQEKLDALHAFESSHQEQCVPIASEDQFYGVSRGVDRLQRYVQWVYVPAVKDAVEEQEDSKNTAVGKLLLRRVHSQLNVSESIESIRRTAAAEYQRLIDGKKDALKAVSDSLNTRFHIWAHDGANVVIDWKAVENSVTVSPPLAQVRTTERVFEGSLARFGHGLQRSFIFALLQELAEHGDTGPRLLLGCEEPELYQHPPQARYLAGVMQQLSSQNAQVMVSTHSPHFISGKSFEHIRMVIKNGATGAATVKQVSFDDIATTIASATGADKPVKTGGMEAKVEQEMHGPMNEMFFATIRVLVEGIEDIAYISSYLTLMDRWQEFRRLGCHLVQVQGKHHLIEAIAIAKHFDLPTVVVFDADGDTPEDTPDRVTGRRNKQMEDNNAVLTLMGARDAGPFPTDIVWRDDLVVWPTNIGKMIENDIGAEDLSRIRQDVRRKQGLDTPNMEKNSMFIGYVMAQAWEEGRRCPTLEELCTRILKYAAAENGIPMEHTAGAGVARALVPETPAEVVGR